MTRNVEIEYKMAYATYIGYELKALVGDDDCFMDFGIMKRVSEIAFSHYFQMKSVLESKYTADGGYLPTYKEVVDMDAFYKDAYKDACKLFVEYLVASE